MPASLSKNPVNTSLACFPLETYPYKKTKVSLLIRQKHSILEYESVRSTIISYYCHKYYPSAAINQRQPLSLCIYLSISIFSQSTQESPFPWYHLPFSDRLHANPTTRAVGSGAPPPRSNPCIHLVRISCILARDITAHDDNILSFNASRSPLARSPTIRSPPGIYYSYPSMNIDDQSEG